VGEKAMTYELLKALDRLFLAVILVLFVLQMVAWVDVSQSNVVGIYL
jgi:hypothetical protein